MGRGGGVGGVGVGRGVGVLYDDDEREDPRGFVLVAVVVDEGNLLEAAEVGEGERSGERSDPLLTPDTLSCGVVRWGDAHLTLSGAGWARTGWGSPHKKPPVRRTPHASPLVPDQQHQQPTRGGSQVEAGHQGTDGDLAGEVLVLVADVVLERVEGRDGEPAVRDAEEGRQEADDGAVGAVGADGGNERGNEEDPGGAGRDQGAGRDRERLEKLADRVRDVVEQDGDGRRPLGRPGDVLLQYPGVR